MSRFAIYTFFPILALLAPSNTAFAACASPDEYDLLAPIGTLTGCVNLANYLKGILETTIGIAGILAVIMIVICGIQLMASGSVSGKSAAKECITNAIFGVLLAIGSWLLLNTINPLLLKNTQTLVTATTLTTPPAAGPTTAPMPTEAGWYFRYRDSAGNIKNSPKYETSESCLQLQKKEADNGSVIQNGPNGTPGCFEIRKSAQPAGEVATRNSICGNDSCTSSSNSNVYINKNSCAPTNTGGVNCTNVDGLDGTLIGDLKSLASACGCKVTITGGTEGGHSSHGSGIPVFDLSKTDTLYNFIKTNATVKANPSFCDVKAGYCFQKWLYNGYWFTDETGGSKFPHWHVCRDGTTAPAGKSAGLFQKACTQI
jgi:type IV secretory pathway VirB2 component (pilin)